MKKTIWDLLLYTWDFKKGKKIKMKKVKWSNKNWEGFGHTKTA